MARSPSTQRSEASSSATRLGRCQTVTEAPRRRLGRETGAAPRGGYGSAGRLRSNYFRLGTVSKAYRTVDSHLRYRVRQWLCVKFKVRGQGTARFPDQHLYRKLGLYRLPGT
jgi:RNA-directed DNA polymerase